MALAAHPPEERVALRGVLSATTTLAVLVQETARCKLSLGGPEIEHGPRALDPRVDPSMLRAGASPGRHLDRGGCRAAVGRKPGKGGVV